MTHTLPDSTYSSDPKPLVGAVDGGLRVPDVTGLSPLDAALAYARCGWYVLPTDPVDVKNPGSVVKGRWHEKSTRDPDQIRAWWTENPDYGIALHVGRSGAVMFDLDIDDLDAIARAGRPDIADALRSAGAIQGTRREGDRGHYLFDAAGVDYGNAPGAFVRWGQVRGKNGVMVTTPTPHPDAGTKGGRYQWARTGGLSPVPDVLRACLSQTGESPDPLTDAELAAFLAAHDRYGNTGKLSWVLLYFDRKINDGASRHDALIDVLTWAFEEAVAGFYPARMAYDKLGSAFLGKFGDPIRGRLHPGHDELQRAAMWAAAKAQQKDPHQRRVRTAGLGAAK